MTGGRFTAAAVGSWERGFREPTVERLAELCACYQVPLTQILTGEGNAGGGSPATKRRPGVDLESLAGEGGPEARAVRRFAVTASARRARPSGDGGATPAPVVAIRQGDYDVLALALDTSAEGLQRRTSAG